MTRTAQGEQLRFKTPCPLRLSRQTPRHRIRMPGEGSKPAWTACA